MNAEQLLAHYDRVADAPDAVDRMRRLILALAVRGKLVPQDPDDEPASQLLRRIAAEKARLVENGEVRKKDVRDFSMVSPPHEIPPSWRWTTLGNVFRYDAGTKRDPKTLDPSRWLLELEDVEKETGRLLVRVKAADRESKSTKSEFIQGDILYGKLRPYLTKALVADQPGYSTTEIVAVRSYIPLCSEYSALTLRRPDFVEYVTRLGQGTKMPRLRTEDAVVSAFPLPPLGEQHRIVARVDELMALCDGLTAARESREAARDRLTTASLTRLNEPDPAPETFRADAARTLNTLPALTTRADQIKHLRQTILNLAVRGKLVPQDPNDEPASTLIKRIAPELTGQGTRRGRKPKPLPKVDLADAPFELPDGWTWTRFPELGKFGRGKSKHRPRNDPALYIGGTHLMIQTGDVARSRGTITSYTNKYNDVGLAQSMLWPKGTLCITIAANIADSGILNFDACFPDSVVGFLPARVFETARYFEYFVRTTKANLLEFAPATAQKNINLEILMSVLIPLPPLAEQKRIVTRVDELMALCDALEQNLERAKATRSRLLDALIHEALQPAESAMEAAE